MLLCFAVRRSNAKETKSKKKSPLQHVNCRCTGGKAVDHTSTRHSQHFGIWHSMGIVALPMNDMVMVCLCVAAERPCVSMHESPSTSEKQSTYNHRVFSVYTNESIKRRCNFCIVNSLCMKCIAHGRFFSCVEESFVRSVGRSIDRTPFALCVFVVCPSARRHARCITCAPAIWQTLPFNAGARAYTHIVHVILVTLVTRQFAFVSEMA